MFKINIFYSQIRYKGKKLDAYKHAYFRKRESSSIEHNTVPGKNLNIYIYLKLFIIIKFNWNSLFYN